ncbi:MAG: hypothetical protein Q8914_06340 [Bacteroidota bacterium]|nr:hypothetical protein [Bacteroidota bacterium]
MLSERIRHTNIQATGTARLEDDQAKPIVEKMLDKYGQSICQYQKYPENSLPFVRLFLAEKNLPSDVRPLLIWL